MTEKNYCGLCVHIQTKSWNNKKGVFINYCPIIDKEVSMVGFACPNYKKKQEDNTGWEISEITMNGFSTEYLRFCMILAFVSGLALGGLFL